MKKILLGLVHVVAVAVLTIVTQVGGLAYLLAWGAGRLWKRAFKGKGVVLFLLFYLLFTFGLTPNIAPFFGREKVRHVPGVRPANYMTVVLNRNYVRPLVNDVLAEAAESLRAEGIQIRYLDANFPFLDDFPLLPHLSHDDGLKIDLCLVYETKDGQLTNRKKSISGYGVFALPKDGETDQARICASRGHWQYSLNRFASFGQVNGDLQFSRKGTKSLINKLLRNKRVRKIFLEPHLKSRLGLKDARIRYHGCHAVRHDDHIHIEVK